MKIFTWMQNKFSGRHGIKKPSFTIDQMLQEPQKEELSDYHHGLLAIGTFGEHNLKDDQVRRNLEGNLSSSEDHLQDLTLEELGKLLKGLNLLLHEQVESTCCKESEAINLQLLDRESSLEAGLLKVDINSCLDESKSKDSSLQRSTSIILKRGKYIGSDNIKAAIGKKSLSFLLKKIFVCRSGFSPAPNLRDQLPELRMEKILRAMLHKKIYPQSSSKALSMKKYLENRLMPKSAAEDELNDKSNNGSKWLNTDSEYIVLEI
ncbi:protein DEEPER ROOTING 1 [Quercus robur]|uniref:protein DEEPER ROOTING 1 n=1 Tax=Quercus robur TaxID=38942 RepID=UPI002162EC71|nr:protein DEEPER ROOTING 1 [Quercus robur]